MSPKTLKGHNRFSMSSFGATEAQFTSTAGDRTAPRATPFPSTQFAT